MSSTQTKSYYRIREVVDMLDITASTLRYWESEFEQLSPDRSPRGQRRYRAEDIEICRRIIYLLRVKGYSVEYARKALGNERKYPPRHPFICRSAANALRLLSEVKDSSDDPHAEARIEAVQNWINNSFPNCSPKT